MDPTMPRRRTPGLTDAELRVIRVLVDSTARNGE